MRLATWVALLKLGTTAQVSVARVQQQVAEITSLRAAVSHQLSTILRRIALRGAQGRGLTKLRERRADQVHPNAWRRRSPQRQRRYAGAGSKAV